MPQTAKAGTATVRQFASTIRHTSVRDMARRIYALYGETSEDAVDAFCESAEENGLGRELQELAARMLLDQERRNDNKPVYARAQALSESLRIEAPPAGYKEPSAPAAPPVTVTTVRERVSSLQMVMTGDDQGRGYAGRRPLAALRAALDLKLPNAMLAKHATKDVLMQQATLLEQQAQGALNHAAILRDLADVMLPGEKALTAVSRLERGTVKPS